MPNDQKMSKATALSRRRRRIAPYYPIPPENILCIEHPAFVKNVDKALLTIGGIEAINNIYDISHTEPMLLRMRPKDIMEPPVEAQEFGTKNVLLKITVPKRRHIINTAEESSLLQALFESKGRYKVEALGNVTKNMRFRDMTDFMWNTSSSNITKHVRDDLLPMKLDNIKNFHLDPDQSTHSGMELMRPPRFTPIVVPQSYAFQQNPNIREEKTETGEQVLVNFSRGQLTQTQYGNWNSFAVPSKSDLPAPWNETTKKCIEHLQRIFDRQPIWSRRALTNATPAKFRGVLKFAYPHVSYYWKSGPWRDTCVKFGIDPRSSPEYAQYQVVAFKMDAMRSVKAQPAPTSHVFDGTKIIQDGRVYMFKDITDPILRDLVVPAGDHIRDTLDRRDGWYKNNRMFKIKYIMRIKVNNLLAKKGPTDDAEFEDVLKQPDHVDDWTEKYAHRKEDGGRNEGNQHGKVNREVEDEIMESEDEEGDSHDEMQDGEDGMEGETVMISPIKGREVEVDMLRKELKKDGNSARKEMDADEDEEMESDEEEENGRYEGDEDTLGLFENSSPQMRMEDEYERDEDTLAVYESSPQSQSHKD